MIIQILHINVEKNNKIDKTNNEKKIISNRCSK